MPLDRDKVNQDLGSMSGSIRESVRANLHFIYGAEQVDECYRRLVERLAMFKAHYGNRASEDFPLSERDVVLIAYPDMLRSPNAPSLETLHTFLAAHLKDIVSTVHLLPFFPFSSDDGFSVVDYREVNPELGTWGHVQRLSQDFRLMFDAVVNHVSARSVWFEGFLKGDESFSDYFITVDPGTDLSMVVRPRDIPLLTPVLAADGERHVWTTFSADQIDLNYANPNVLLEMIDLLLFYVERGASIIRLDAVAYLWKEIGTSCIHLPQTHAIIQICRAILDDIASGVMLITETNVPHAENISYFGDGNNEAHLVYQFPLPPLLAHTILTGNARHLREWAGKLAKRSDTVAFFNFSASHDGIGLRPAAGILSESEIQRLIATTYANGGDVSYQSNSDGSASPYELNITYYDLLNSPELDEPQELKVRRFLASQGLMLALAGVPGIYFHNLVGSRNNSAGVEESGHRRAINRERLDLAALQSELRASNTRRNAIYNGYRTLIQKRTGERAFHPTGEQRVLDINDAVFGILRLSPSEDSAIIALHNVSATSQSVTVKTHPADELTGSVFHDILSNKQYRADSHSVLHVELLPYQISWLKPIKA